MKTSPRILIIEDDIDAREFIRYTLEFNHFEVVAAPSGVEALIVLETDAEFDVILLDMMLPGIDGFEMLRIIQEDPLLSHIRVIICTALTSVEDKVKSFSLGAADYLVKPFESRELVVRIETQIKMKRAEQEISTLARIPEENPNPVLRIAPDGHLLYANPAAITLLQWCHTLPQYPVPESWLGTISHVLKSNRRAELEITCNDRTFHCLFVPLVELNYVNVYANDITARLQIERELRASEKRYRQAMENSPNPIFCIEQDGRITIWNRACETIFECPANQAIGQPYQEILGLENAEVQRALTVMVNNVFNFQRSFSDVQLTIKNKDGSQRIMNSRLYPMLNLSGSVQACVFANTDITSRIHAEQSLRSANTQLQKRVRSRSSELEQINRMLKIEVNERRQTEAALQESEARFRQFAENIREVFWMAAPELEKILYVSPAYEKIWGKSRESYYARPESFLDAIHPEDRDFVREAIRLRQREGYRRKEYSVEYRLVRPDGAVRWIWDRAFPIRNKDGEVYRVAGVAADITERRRAEEQLKHSLHEKEVLLQEIHHRVKNNMQVISSLLSLQSDYVSDPETRKMFADSQNRIRSMALVHEKLYRSQNLAQINFAEYIRDLVSFLSRSLDAARQGVQVDIAADSVLLNIEVAVPCGLIINELMTNALKHAFPNGRQGKIRVELTAKNSQYQLSVTDNGVGLPENFALGQTDTLGLQLVETLVDQLDGHLHHVKTSQGTTFQITFPVR